MHFGLSFLCRPRRHSRELPPKFPTRTSPYLLFSGLGSRGLGGPSSWGLVGFRVWAGATVSQQTFLAIQLEGFSQQHLQIP